jgi:hypothetical protein
MPDSKPVIDKLVGPPIEPPPKVKPAPDVDLPGIEPFKIPSEWRDGPLPKSPLTPDPAMLAEGPQSGLPSNLSGKPRGRA